MSNPKWLQKNYFDKGYFVPFKVRLLRDVHPEGYEDEWTNAGTILDAVKYPDNTVGIGFADRKGNMYISVISNAKEGVDWEKL